MADTVCKNFIMEVVDKTWYKELEDLGTLYTNVTSIKLLDHINEFCSGLYTVNAVDIQQPMKMLFTDADGIPQLINTMETAQKNPKREKLVIRDEYMHAVALKSLLQLGEYETEMKEWPKIPDDQKTWEARKTTFREAYVAKIWA